MSVSIFWEVLLMIFDTFRTGFFVLCELAIASQAGELSNELVMSSAIWFQSWMLISFSVVTGAVLIILESVTHPERASIVPTRHRHRQLKDFLATSIIDDTP